MSIRSAVPSHVTRDLQSVSRSVNQSVLVSKTSWGPLPDFCSLCQSSCTPSVAVPVSPLSHFIVLVVFTYIYIIIIIIISNLSKDRSKASSKTIPPHSAIQSFLLQLTESSPVLKVIQQLLTPSSSSSCHFYLPLYLSFNNLLQKASFYVRCDQSSQPSVFLFHVGYFSAH